MEYLNTAWQSSGESQDYPVGKSYVDPTGNYVTEWTSFAVPLSGDISDSANHHSATTLFGHGARYMHGFIDFQLIGGDLGEEIQIRTYEVDSSGTRKETHKPHEFYLSANPIPNSPANGEPLYPKSTHQRYPIQGYVNSGHFLKAELTGWGDPGKPLALRYIQVVAYFWS